MEINTTLEELGNEIKGNPTIFEDTETFSVWLDMIIEDMLYLYDECDYSIYQYQIMDVVKLLELLNEKIKKQ